MHLTHLRLLNFRNHARTALELSPHMNLFIGANAQGKSSLLEAVEVAATGRSHRAAQDAECMRFGESWARVRAAGRRRDRDVEVDVAWWFEGVEGPLDAGTGPRRAGAPREDLPLTKEVRVNGVPVRRGELFGHVLFVAASPEDERVISGGPVHRRRLLDLLLAQISPTYFFTLVRYTRAVAQRNRLLRDLARTARREGGDALESWDDQVAAMGATITARRRELVARLSHAAQMIYGALSGGQEVLTVMYAPSMRGRDERELVAEAREALVRRRPEELSRGATLVGPHRDELVMQIDGRDLRTFGSRGQQQTAMLALRLAERSVLREEAGEEPVLLLDDTLLALDEQRQAQLLALLGRAQALVTVTTMATVHQRPAHAAVFTVAGGTVEMDRAHTA